MTTEKEILLEKTFDCFMDQGCYQNDLALLEHIIDPNMMGFGSAIDEQIFSLQDLLTMLQRQKEQSEDMDVKWVRKPLHYYISSDENTVTFAENLLINLSMQGNTIEMHVRFSVVLEYKNDKWVVVHFHASKPENVLGEEDTFGIEAWKHKAEELEKIIAERTADLVVKNKELEIEYALEKVRSRSLSMYKSEELTDVVAILFEKLRDLKIPVTAVGIGIPIEGSKDLNTFVCGESENHLIVSNYRLPYFENVISTDLYNAFEKQLPLFIGNYSKEEKNSFYEYLFEHSAIKNVPNDIKRMIFDSPTYTISMVAVKNAVFNINDFDGKNLTKIEVDIIKRFANVFDQAYTRFLDLQRAEAQSKEAKIEAALERVRSRSLSIHQTSEIQSVIYTVHEELVKLNLSIFGGSFIVINKDIDTELYAWGSGATAETPTKIRIPDFGMPFCTNLISCIKHGQGFFIEEFSSQQKIDYFTALFNQEPWSNLLEEQKKEVLQSEGGYTRSICVLANTSIFIVNQNGRNFTAEENDILRRFTKVFEQCYTRFLDLQKAEAQAREAQIELSLERIRAKVTAMQRSADLLDIVVTMRTEFISLGHMAHYFWHMRWQPNTYEKAMTSGDGTRIGMVMELPRGFHNISAMTAWEDNSESYAVFALDVDSAIDYVDRMVTTAKFSEIDPNAPGPDAIRSIGGLTFVMARTTHGEIGYSLPGVVANPPAEDVATLVRFAAVFDLAYRRFEDLQSSEKRIREAQIELAIERVRAKTMAMQRSSELAEAASLLFHQVKGLGVQTYSSGFTIWDAENQHLISWMCNADGSINPPFRMPVSENDWHVQQYELWKKEEDFIVKDMTGNALQSYFAYLRSFPLLDEAFKTSIAAGHPMPERQVHNVANFSHGSLLFITYEQIPEAHDIFKRFAKVFQQAYIRFLDLQNAEMQAREAQINLAVERVRAKALAMQHSTEIIDIVIKLKDEVMGLHIPGVIAATIFLKEEDDKVRMWDLSSIEKQEEDYDQRLDITFKLKDEDPDFYVKRVWENPADFFVEIQDEKGFQRLMSWLREQHRSHAADDVADYLASVQLKQLYHVVKKINNGKLAIDLLNPPEAEVESILTKMGAAFDLAYKRFEDLQNSEEQLREARIEAALERVRSRTLAMQKSDELAETSAVLFQQLILLGIEPNRLYITIIKDEQADAEFWITDEDSTQVSAAFETNLHNTAVFKKMLDGWKEKKQSLTIDLDGKELDEYFKYLDSLHVSFKGGLTQRRRIQYIAYFNKGFIGIASPEEQSEETLFLLERFAAVFNLTFTRFNDLKIAEAHNLQSQQDLIAIKEAKQKAEQALNELQLTQAQLIQSEKLASLGELTAGIAHEIQNPLNFVNNFSELSVDLVKDLRDELEKSSLTSEGGILIMDKAYFDELFYDLSQNQEKINHHGKRASSIVKGMLEHSRASTGVKELTDINQIADEYLRLAYHGLRAKDKTFNADFKTEFDKDLPKIAVIPQDIGRVLLNMINNAFYAVSSQTPKPPKGGYPTEPYMPTVTVSTHYQAPPSGAGGSNTEGGGSIIVKIKDNGIGMSEETRAKIFQPFFTTKPTGQGTGLGLSLAYDIVKAHGGEIKVDSKEIEGTIFSIVLPI